jgi:2-alkenal reductase
MTNGIKIALASFLLVMLLALGSLSIATSGLNGALAGVISNAQTVAQKIEASQAVQVKNSDPTATGATQTQAAQAAQGSGVVDARATAKLVGPAVVTVVNNLQTQSTGRRSINPNANPEALGTGVIIDTQGHIVTNNHVIENQASLEVIFSDGTRAPATLVGGDAYSDIAVIKVDVKVPAVAKFGDSTTLEAGLPVLAIGSALGDYANTVTEGIISGLHREITGGDTALRDLIQTDAAINHGNSGGPLIDIASGNVIGINTAVVRTTGTGFSADVAEGLGFAIPSNTVKTVVDSLLKNGAVVRPYIGIEYVQINPQVAAYYNLSRQTGIYVNSVASGSPAEKAGIQTNSIITKIDGTALNDTTNLADLLLKHKVGDSVKLTVIAPNSTTETDVTVVLTQRP